MIEMIHDLQLPIVDFELHAKEIVDRINGSNKNDTKLGVVVYDCKHCCSMYFTRKMLPNLVQWQRQVNEIGHTLV
jgi:hypothetical protein